MYFLQCNNNLYIFFILHFISINDLSLHLLFFTKFKHTIINYKYILILILKTFNNETLFSFKYIYLTNFVPDIV